jgi:hypothetical protein
MQPPMATSKNVFVNTGYFQLPLHGGVLPLQVPVPV